MRILVPTKRVPDPDQTIRLDSVGTAVNLEGVPCIINPFDSIAIEEALRIRDEQRAGTDDVEVVAVSIGDAECVKELRMALAMGADRAVLVETDESPDPWGVATVLQAVVQREQPEMVLLGKQAVDDDSNQAGQFLAARLSWPQATFASRIEFADGGVRVARETDAGTELVFVQLPAVVTADLRLNEPRYASLPAIMRAKKKPLEQLTVAELGVTLERKVEVIEMETVSAKRNCELLSSVDELVAKLREAEVI